MNSMISLIRLSCQMYKKDLALWIGYSAWMLLPVAASAILTLLPDAPIIPFLDIILAIIGFAIVLWMTIAIALHAYELIFQKKDSTPFSTRIKKLFVPVLVVSLLQTLMFVGGFILLIVPGFIFGVWYAMAQNIVIFENKSAVNALTRSRALIKGRFWKSTAYLLGGPLLMFLCYYLVLSIVIGGISMAQSIDVSTFLTGELPLWLTLLESVGEMFIFPLFIIYYTYVYKELYRE